MVSMGRITDIKPQAKRPDRVSVYLDGKYVFSLARDQLASLGLKTGQELDPKDVARLKDASAFGKLRDLTYRWLALRLRSEHEIDQYLRRKTEDEELKERLKQELKLYNYIDDAKFAAAWIADRRAVKPASRYRLKRELLQKRVPLAIIDDQLDSADLDDVAAAKAIIARRGARYDDKRKLMAYLARQGFSYDAIKRALADED